MNQNLQPELHPSVELLSAFAEQALDAREHEQMLTHLATCGRCREVVFLAQEAALVEEPVVVAESVPAKTLSPFGRWFGGLNLVWAGGLAAAVMVLVIVSVYLLRSAQAPEMAKTTRPAAEQATQAKMEPAPAVPAAPLAAASTKPRPAPLRVRQPAIAADKDANASSKVQRGADLDSLSDDPTKLALPVNGRNFQTFLPQPGLVAPQLAARGVAGTISLNSATAAGEAKASSIADAAQSQTAAAIPAPQIGVAQPAPAPGSVSQTVEVSAANAAVETEPVGSSAPLTLHGAARMAKKTQPALPSGLPAVSSVEAGGRRVAVDADGHVFFSRDAGVAWQAVAVQWTGKAVSVRPGFELVNDGGSAWNSIDGLVWTAKR